MSPQLQLRREHHTRRSMEDIKIDYDRALHRAAWLDNRYAGEISRLHGEYAQRRTELRAAGRNADRARRNDMTLEAAKWSAKAEFLRETAMPALLQKLAKLVDEIEYAQRSAELLRTEIAIRAGIAPAFQHDIKIVSEPRGVFSIYFGGIGSPDGPGHAHYVFDEYCECSYRREPTRQRPVSAWRR